jgi:rubrerythrin
MDRRELLAWALAGSGAGVLTASAAASADVTRYAPDSDAGVVYSALRVELLAVYVYQQVLAGGKLGATAQELARGILQHELTHASTLKAELARLGTAPPAPPARVSAADDQLAKLHSSGSLTAVHRELGALDLLYDIEAITLGTYYTALKRLSDPRLMRVAAEIMGAEAQHAAALGGLLHPGKWDRVVPVASVEGKH